MDKYLNVLEMKLNIRYKRNLNLVKSEVTKIQVKLLDNPDKIKRLERLAYCLKKLDEALFLESRSAFATK